jgi:hypothetical protein
MTWTVTGFRKISGVLEYRDPLGMGRHRRKTLSFLCFLFRLVVIKLGFHQRPWQSSVRPWWAQTTHLSIGLMKATPLALWECYRSHRAMQVNTDA